MGPFVSPHGYLLTRRLERAAAQLRDTDRSVTDICLSIGLKSLASFTTSFTRIFGASQTAYEELKARGVEFTAPPEEYPYGIDSGFRDPSGNSVRLTQVTVAGV